MAAPMKLRLRFCCKSRSFITPTVSVSLNKLIRSASGSTNAVDESEANANSHEFRHFQLRKVKPQSKRPFRKELWGGSSIPQPRSTKMPVNQDWTNVWPTAHTFKWSVVPLPIRQGALKKRSEATGDGFPPGKFANTELIKIPNFLHLTPKHIEKHCEVLKDFCTPWPSELDSNEQINYHFPIEVITQDYSFSASSVRDPRARVVTMKFNLKDFKLDQHAKEKMQRLLKMRGNKVTLTSDRCPLKKQNYDFLQYLLTALYFESWKVEAWESEMTVEDMFRYSWDHSPNKENIVNLLNIYREKDQSMEKLDQERELSYLPKENVTPDSVTSLEPVKEYKSAVENLHNHGENISTLNRYKQSVVKLLNVQRKTTHSDV